PAAAFGFEQQIPLVRVRLPIHIDAADTARVVRGVHVQTWGNRLPGLRFSVKPDTAPTKLHIVPHARLPVVHLISDRPRLRQIGHEPHRLNIAAHTSYSSLGRATMTRVAPVGVWRATRSPLVSC